VLNEDVIASKSGGSNVEKDGLLHLMASVKTDGGSFITMRCTTLGAALLV